jgi:hypothetical protein
MGRLASRCLLIVTIVNSLEGAAVRVVSDAERTEGCVAVPLYRHPAPRLPDGWVDPVGTIGDLTVLRPASDGNASPRDGGLGQGRC